MKHYHTARRLIRAITHQTSTERRIRPSMGDSISDLTRPTGQHVPRAAPGQPGRYGYRRERLHVPAAGPGVTRYTTAAPRHTHKDGTAAPSCATLSRVGCHRTIGVIDTAEPQSERKETTGTASIIISSWHVLWIVPPTDRITVKLLGVTVQSSQQLANYLDRYRITQAYVTRNLPQVTVLSDTQTAPS